jgi:hypothetical protein
MFTSLQFLLALQRERHLLRESEVWKVLNFFEVFV